MIVLVLTGFGDWIDGNLGMLVTIAGGLVVYFATALIAFISLRSQVNVNSEKIKELEHDMTCMNETLNKHRENEDKHVNKFQISNLEKRMSDVETAINKSNHTLNGISSGQTAVLSAIRDMAREIRNGGKS